MNHGSQCDCIMCSIGKKIGMIKSAEKQGHGAEQVAETCSHCGGAIKEGVTHTCAS